ENYSSWRDQILTRLEQHNMDQIAKGRVNWDTVPADPADALDTIFRAMRGYIADQLTTEVLSVAAHCKKAAVLWTYLHNEYGAGHADQKEAIAMRLNAELDAIPFPCSPTKLEEFIGKVDAIRSKFIIFGDPSMTDARLALRIIREFPDPKAKQDALSQNLTWT